MATKKTLTEAVMRRLNAGDPSVGSRIHPLEVEAALGQALNTLLRPEYFENLQVDGNIPSGYVIATYDDVPVETYKDVSKAVLPAIPANLPKGIGVFQISGVQGDIPEEESITGEDLEYIVGLTEGGPVAGTTTFKKAVFQGRRVRLFRGRVRQSTLSLEGELYYLKPLGSDTLTIYGDTWQPGELVQFEIY